MKEIFEAIKIIQGLHPELRRKVGIDFSGTKSAKNAIGTIECPKCKGKLNYSMSGYNGHIHGNCQTEGCLSWMM